MSRRFLPTASVLLATILSTGRALAAFPEPDALPAQAAPPDPLVSSSGQRVTTREGWTHRAAELRALFQHYEYGMIPPPAKFAVKVVREDKEALGGKATLREITLALERPEGTQINLLLVIPNKRTTPAPVFLGLNFRGNLALLPDPAIGVPAGWKPKTGETIEQARGSEMANWMIEGTINHGYAVASFWNSDVVPDDKAGAEAVLRKFRPAGPEERGASDTATIAAWAWCLQRAVDYLVTDAEIDAKRIAVVGHSRNGKTALLAAAFDPRIALVIPSQAGCGGSAPVRMAPEQAKLQDNGRPTAETVAVITRSFPHWFCGNFKSFGETPEKLPFDQHALVALCAPRPVLFSCAAEDLWANPSGQFEMLRAADPVYRLVAGDGLGAAEMPEIGKLLPSRLGYFIRPGRHSMTPGDWAAWLDYADRWLKP